MKSLLVLLSLLIATLGFAKIPEPQKNTYVNDYAHVLSKKQIKILNERIKAFENKTTVQLAVILVNRIPEEYTIEEYALLIGRKWHVGTADNGLVYVMAIKQRQQRLEVARAMQPIINDFKAQIILDDLKNDLREKHYASAVHQLINSTENQITLIKAEEQQKLVEEEATTKAQNAALMGGLRMILLVVGFLVGIFFIFKAIGWLFRRFINRSPVSKYSGSYYVESTNYSNNYIDVDSSYMVINSYNSQYNTINSNNRYNDYRKINNNYYDSRPRRNNSSYFASQSLGSSRRNNDSGSSKSESSSYGNWGNSSSGGSSSSPSSGFNGGGASSSW